MQRDRARLIRAAGRVAVAAAATPAAYLAAALLGAIVPRNAGWEEPERGIEIFVRTNGVHSDLVLPAEAAGVDWYALVPPEHVAEPTSARGWVAIGWGQREFYLETETWADLRARTALRAATGGAALMHVQHGARPAPSDAFRPLVLEPHGYQRMADTIDASFYLDDLGRARPLLGRGYGADDVFYAAHGVYHAFRTSNQWTADMLAEGGVEIGVFTPFEQSVMWRFR